MAKVAITEQYLTNIANAIRSKTGLSATFYPSEMANAISAISSSGGITPTGTISITENGTYSVTSYASASVNVPTGSTINNQDKTVNPSTSQQSITADSGYTGLGTVTVNAMPAGTAGTPTASKGTVSNHSISVTPSVTNTTGYITGSTKTGTAVTVSASELVSGNKEITSNGTNIDVTNYATVSVEVAGGGGYISQDANGYITLSSTDGLPVLKTKSITANGTYNASSDNANGYSNVSVNVSPNLTTKLITANGTYSASSDSADGYSSVTVNTPSYGILTVTASSSATYPKKLTFSNVSGEPTAFYLYIAGSFNGGTNSVIVARYDGTNLYWVYLASNSSSYYEQINTGGFSYSNHTLSIYISTGSDSDYGVRFHPGANYELIYFY